MAKYDFLILGGAGMQGRIAARDLLENGQSVFLADLYRESAAKLLERPNTGFAFVDLRKRGMVVYQDGKVIN